MVEVGNTQSVGVPFHTWQCPNCEAQIESEQEPASTRDSLCEACDREVWRASHAAWEDEAKLSFRGLVGSHIKDVFIDDDGWSIGNPAGAFLSGLLIEKGGSEISILASEWRMLLVRLSVTAKLTIHGSPVWYQHQRFSEAQFAQIASDDNPYMTQFTLDTQTVKHWKDCQEPISTHGGVTRATIELDDKLWCGQAQCSYLDQFSRPMGRRIATGRLVKALFEGGVLKHDEYLTLRRQVQGRGMS